MKRSFFFKFDLFLCSAWALFVAHLWVSNLLTSFCLKEATEFLEWTLPLVTYTVLLRLNLSFMMWRKEKQGWLTAIICFSCGMLCYFVLMAKPIDGMSISTALAVRQAFLVSPVTYCAHQKHPAESTIARCSYRYNLFPCVLLTK